jgi:hypothetical protein
MLRVLEIATAMILAQVNGGGQSGNSAPIFLSAEPEGGLLRVKVIGAPSVDYEASFSLEVTSNGNHSVHRGSASLKGGDAVTLSTVTLGGATGAEWRAHLKVESSNGASYEQVRTGR